MVWRPVVPGDALVSKRCVILNSFLVCSRPFPVKKALAGPPYREASPLSSPDRKSSGSPGKGPTRPGGGKR